MTTATYLTNRGLHLVMTGGITLSSSTLNVMLIQTEVAAATGRDDNFVSDVLGHSSEANCTGYARTTLGACTAVEDDTNDRSALDYPDISWGSLGGGTNCPIAQMVVYKTGASDAAREVIAYIGSANLPQTTNGAPFTTTIADLFRANSTAT